MMVSALSSRRSPRTGSLICPGQLDEPPVRQANIQKRYSCITPETLDHLRERE